MKWLLWLLWDTLGALDCVDLHGKPDHGKVMGLVAFVALYALEAYLVVTVHHVPTLGEWIILGTLPFGLIAWRILLRSGILSAKETSTHAVTEALAAAGVRPPGVKDTTEATAGD